MKYFIKVITGYNSSVTIPAEEAHKAYYLFLHPDERTIFSNGVALISNNIMRIEPDYNKTMGWNENYPLIADDYADIRDKGVDKKIQAILEKAKDVAMLAEKQPELLQQPLSQISDTKKIGGGNDYYDKFRLS